MAFDSKRIAAEAKEQELLRTHSTGHVRIRSVEHPGVVTEVTCANAARLIVAGTATAVDATEGVQ